MEDIALLPVHGGYRIDIRRQADWLYYYVKDEAVCAVAPARTDWTVEVMNQDGVIKRDEPTLRHSDAGA